MQTVAVLRSDDFVVTEGVADGEGRGLEVAIAAEVELVEEHAQAAEHALQHDEADERVGRAADDGPRLAQAVRDGDDHAEQAQARGREAMRMFGELIDLREPARRVDGAVGERPVQEGHAGLDAGREAAGLEHEHRPRQREQAQSEQTSVGRGGFRLGHAPITGDKADGANPKHAYPAS
jgi:hypothetical protein